MKTAVIGYTGFVGSNLIRQHKFTDLYNSQNINSIRNKAYDLIVSAGATADRNIANQNSNKDWRKIKTLLDNLRYVKVKHFILISTIDVYPDKSNANEDTPIKAKNLKEAYGRNRLKMELFVKRNFPKVTIIRCPNLYGINLKKNVVFDLIHNTNLEKRHRDSMLQYYNLDNLWNDIQEAIKNNISTINLSVEPVTIREIAKATMNTKFTNISKEAPMFLNFKSKYADLWKGKNEYLYNKKETLRGLKNFVLQEIKQLKRPKIAISNLAWDHSEDVKVVPILQKYNINAIEIAPSKIWPDPSKAKVSQIKDYRQFWNKRGIEIIATTHLLSPHPELTLFENNKTRIKSLKYLKSLIKISSILGAKVMNFGSPKNRRKGSLTNKEAFAISQNFFSQIARECEKYNINFAFEPNPPIYGGDFIHTTKEAVYLAKKVKHQNFGVNIDLSTMIENREDFENTIKLAMPYAKHLHISEPYLVAMPKKISAHKILSRAIDKTGFTKYLSIEMALDKKTNHPLQIEKTLKFITKVYN